MPTTRRRSIRQSEAPVAAGVVYLMRTGQIPDRDQGLGLTDWDTWAALDRFTSRNREKLLADWLVVRDGLMAAWIRTTFGTRPWVWWKLDAPRWRRQDQPERVRSIVTLDCAEPRRRLGGIGTPAFEALNYIPRFIRGVPSIWISVDDESYYNGRSRDVHGNRIGTEYTEGHFSGLAPRADDPPTFESEASYLKRHGLFATGEEKRLTQVDFEPEVLTVKADEAGEKA